MLDAPALVDDALTLTDDVRVFCDDWRDAARVDPALLVEHPNDLAGVDVALARLPKSLAALDEQAAVVQGAQDVTFVGGARIKHLNHTMNQVLNKHFAAVSASLGRAKSARAARLGPRGAGVRLAQGAHARGVRLRRRRPRRHVRRHEGRPRQPPADDGAGGRRPRPRSRPTTCSTSAAATARCRCAWPRTGSGVAARDVSWSAVAGTAVAAEVNGLEVDATWGDGLDGYADASFDAIVTNPPFHQGVAKDTTDTLRLFDEAARVLRPGGRLCASSTRTCPTARS